MMRLETSKFKRCAPLFNAPLDAPTSCLNCFMSNDLNSSTNEID